MAVYLYGPQSRLWAFKLFSEPPSSCLGLGLLMNLYLRNPASPGWLTQIVISPTVDVSFLRKLKLMCVEPLKYVRWIECLEIRTFLNHQG